MAGEEVRDTRREPARVAELDAVAGGRQPLKRGEEIVIAVEVLGVTATEPGPSVGSLIRKCNSGRNG